MPDDDDDDWRCHMPDGTGRMPEASQIDAESRGRKPDRCPSPKHPQHEATKTNNCVPTTGTNELISASQRWILKISTRTVHGQR